MLLDLIAMNLAVQITLCNPDKDRLIAILHDETGGVFQKIEERETEDGVPMELYRSKSWLAGLKRETPYEWCAVAWRYEQDR